MPTIGQNWTQLIDFAKSSEDGKSTARVMELLNRSNQIYDDLIYVECNQGTRHRHTIRTGLPEVAWGALYKGIPQSKSSRQQIDDTTGFVEALSSVDKRLLDLAPDPAGYRLSEAKSFLEAMTQDVTQNIFYADTANTPERFKGLAARYNKLPTAGASDASLQVIDGGSLAGQTDNTSIWFVTFGEDATFGIYPNGMRAGIQREDKGEQRVLDAAGNPYYVKEEMFTQHIGICVKDWRQNSRIANIDVSTVQSGATKLFPLMRKAYWKLQARREYVKDQPYQGMTVIYMNRDMLEALDAEATNSGGTDNFTRLKWGEIMGKEVLTYRGLPIRLTDSILNTEARLV